jgi:SAM-dependent methyltransferase
MSPEPVRFILPPRGTFVPNNGVDPLGYYYHPVVGSLFRARLNVGLSLLDRRFHRLLELGYGSGLLMPTLAQVTDELYGVDLEPAPAGLAATLSRFGARPAALVQAPAHALPFEDAFFDGAVAFSIFEHLRPEELEAALAELGRVLQPGAALLVACPAVHKAMSVAFAAIGFRDIEHHHFSSIRDVLAAGARWFDHSRTRTLPALPMPLGWAPYTAVLLRRRRSAT